MIKVTWNPNIPLVGNQLAEDWPDINENFTHLRDFLANIVNAWDSTTATNMFIAKTKRTALTYADSPYTMLPTDVLLECDTSGGAITINLLSAVTVGAGRYFMVKVTDATNTVTLVPAGTETIDGMSTFNIANGGNYIIYSDGANWKHISLVGASICDTDGDTSFRTENAPDEDIVRAYAGAQEVFRGYSSGIFDLAKQSGCYVYTSSSQASSTPPVKVAFDTVLFDVQNEFDTATNYRFTAARAGTYIAVASLHHTVSVDQSLVGVLLYKNGAVAPSREVATSGTYAHIINVVAVIQLAANDYLEVYAQNETNDVVVSNDENTTFFCVAKIA